MSDRVVRWIGGVLLLAPLVMLALLALDLLSVAFFHDASEPVYGGVWPALVGSVCVVAIAGALSVPTAMAAAIYLEEYARPTRLTRLISANIDTLAGVPSVVYGLIGLTVFVRALALGRSLLSAALTLAALCLPLIVVTTREALRQVPQTLRESAFALGATKLECVRFVVLPIALPSVATGVVLALARALGEAAPLLAIFGLAFVPFLPSGPTSPVSTLPLQIFTWITRPGSAYAAAAAAAILTLLALVFLLNGAAIWLRIRAERNRA